MTFKLKVSTLLVVLIAIIMFSCGKERDDDFDIKSRTGYETIETASPYQENINIDTYYKLNNSINAKWTATEINNIYHNVGEILFTQSQIQYSGEYDEPLLVTLPLVKEGSVKGIVLFQYDPIDDVYDSYLLGESILNKSYQDFISTYGNKSKVIVSFFIAHQIYFNKQNHIKASQYLEGLIGELISTREICFIEYCYSLGEFSSQNGSTLEITGGQICQTVYYNCSGGSGSDPADPFVPADDTNENESS